MKKKTFLLIACLGIATLILGGFLYWKKDSFTSYIQHSFFLNQTFHPENAEKFYAAGDYYFGGGAYNVEKAKKNYQEALKINPAYPRAHYQMARIYFIEGNFSEGLREINTELLLFPEYKRSFYVRGLIYGYDGKLDNAIEDFKSFLEWKPSSWAGHNDLVWVYFQKGDYTNAALMAKEGLKYSPENPWLENSVGVALMNLEQFDEAKTYFERAAMHAEKLKVEQWGEAYPGNNPSVYQEGLKAMKDSIQKNLQLLQEKSIDKA